MCIPLSGSHLRVLIHLHPPIGVREGKNVRQPNPGSDGLTFVAIATKHNDHVETTRM
jgi:hypothetical protein